MPKAGGGGDGRRSEPREHLAAGDALAVTEEGAATSRLRRGPGAPR